MPVRRRLPTMLAFAAALCASVAGLALAAHRAQAAQYRPGEVLIDYSGVPPKGTLDLVSRLHAHTDLSASPAPNEQLVQLPPGVSVPAAVAALSKQPGVAAVRPNYLAHAAGAFYPNDPGRTGQSRGWEQLQWNFLAGSGVDAPGAWANLIADHRPGGRGVVVAILDTGVAYRDWKPFVRSPDFAGTRFVKPYDFVAKNAYPLDREGHGTFVAGIVAEGTNNRVGLTGLAYGASIMPVRVLNADGTGDAATISRGIRYAATHGAQVINLSLEFSLDVSASDIPDIMSAIRFAHRRGTMVVASAGNEGVQQVAYPARAPAVVSAGATTGDRCLADYSNGGTRLDLVAPGGGGDMNLAGDPDCHPDRRLPDVFQMTFFNPSRPGRFGLPGGWFGTSMSAPHVAGIAALVIASGVIGRHPSPDQVLARLEATTQPLGGTKPNPDYGYGLVDAAAATAPGGPTSVPRSAQARR